MDTNKGDRDEPDIRCRWVACEVAVHRSDQFFSATPPLEALRLLLSATASGRKDGRKGGRKLLFLDAKKAHLHAPCVREVYVQLPPERSSPGRCCRLLRCLYGTRDAPKEWERYAAERLEAIGFRRGAACPVVFYHPGRDLRGVLHGDDFVFSGGEASLDWVAKALSKDILLKVCGRLGGEAGRGDIQEIRCLNRVLRWTETGVTMEADPRHAEILGKMLGENASPLTTPGVKLKSGSARLDLVTELSSHDAAVALKDAKVRELYAQVFGAAATTGGGQARRGERERE